MFYLLIVGFIVSYIASAIHVLGDREEKLIKAHKDQMRSENDKLIAEYAAQCQ